MTQTQDKSLGMLKKRSEFLYVRDGDYAARGAVVVQSRQNPESSTIRYGVTATKRIGNAVTRNRAKRRLRELAREMLPELGHVGYDYVLIARDRTPTRESEKLRQDVGQALQSLPGPGQRRD